MAAPVINITITLAANASASATAAAIMVPNQSSRDGINRLRNFLGAISAGVSEGAVASFVDAGGGVKASGTVTFSGNPSANDTVTISGEVFTFVAKANEASPNQITIQSTATLNAAALVEAVNKSAIARGQVVATNSAGVVTLTARAPGLYGNGITLAKSGTNIAVSGATLASGTASTGIAGGTYLSVGV